MGKTCSGKTVKLNRQSMQNFNRVDFHPLFSVSPTLIDLLVFIDWDREREPRMYSQAAFGEQLTIPHHQA